MTPIVIYTCRWSPDEHARLSEVAKFAGCSRPRLLRRLLKRPEKSILATRELARQVRALGSNLNQIARLLDNRTPVRRDDLLGTYQQMLSELKAMSS